MCLARKASRRVGPPLLNPATFHAMIELAVLGSTDRGHFPPPSLLRWRTTHPGTAPGTAAALFRDGGKDATHGLGIAFGAFALGNSAGDIVAGFLSEHHRGAACFVSGALGLAGLLSLFLLGWEETAPSARKRDRRRRQRRRRQCPGGGCWWRRAEKRGEGRVGEAEGGASGVVGGRDASGVVGPSGINDNGGGGGGGGGSGETASVIDDNGCRVEDGGEGHGERKGGTGRAAARPVNPISVLKVFLESRCGLRCLCRCV